MGHSQPDVTVTLAPPTAAPTRPHNVADVYREHGDFVWASLQRMGVRDSDLQDQLQEVFVVVHRRLADFEGRSALTTWLFGICLRVVAGYRRKLARRKEQGYETLPEVVDEAEERDPEQSAARQQARARLAEVLDEMDVEKRAVLVMFEVESLSCDEIAKMLSVPVGDHLLAAARGASAVREAAQVARASHSRRLTMSDGPHDPSSQGLSGESLSLLKSAASPRAMTAAERKLAMQSVAKIAATPAIAVGGFSAAKLALATVTTVGAAAALARAVAPHAEPPAQQPTTIAAPTTQAAPRPRDPIVAQSAPAAVPVVAAPIAARTSSPAPTTPTSTRSAPPTLAVRPAATRVGEPVAAGPTVVARSIVEQPRSTPSELTGTIGGAHSLSGGTLTEPPERRETAALEQVFSVASSDPSRAMAMLDAFDREFPRGRLRDEREFLGVLVLDRLGRRDEAQTRARALLERSPGGIYAPRLRRLLERTP
jgi:RNA polymerase sigma-70 factor (ECF subfamily)